MGLNISADVFQRVLRKLFQKIPFVLVYIADMLIITKDAYEQHIEVAKLVLNKL